MERGKERRKEGRMKGMKDGRNGVVSLFVSGIVYTKLVGIKLIDALKLY